MQNHYLVMAKGLCETWTNYTGPHGYNSKNLAKEVKARYEQKSFKGQKLFRKVKIVKKKMPYGGENYFILAKWKC